MILAIINIDKKVNNRLDRILLINVFPQLSLLVLTNLTNTTLITILMSEIKIIVFQ